MVRLEYSKAMVARRARERKELNMSTTDNLKKAFAGESQANRTYLAFAKKADEDGYPQVAKLFRAAADAETVHALGHLGNMSGVNDTRWNLKQAIEGETYEFQKMYPAMVDEAKKEGEELVATFFGYADQVEEIHAGLYSKALEQLGKNTETDYYVCQFCGNTVEGEAPDMCPICGAPKSMFKLIE
jgi:rubrerythrin